MDLLGQSLFKGNLRPPQHCCPSLGKTKGRFQLLRRERAAQSHAIQWVQWKAEQGNRQGLWTGKVAQPQPLWQSLTPWQTPVLLRLALSKPHCQESKVSQGNRASAGDTLSGCTFPACSPSGIYTFQIVQCCFIPCYPLFCGLPVPFIFSTQALAPHQWTLPSLFLHLIHQLAASSRTHISAHFLLLETGSYPPCERSQEHHGYWSCFAS